MGDDPNRRGNSRRWIVGTDIDETLGAPTDLVRSGKVRNLGSSTSMPSSRQPAPRHGRHHVEPARGRLAHRPVPQGRQGPAEQPRRADPAALRHVTRANSRKLDAADALAALAGDAGVSLIHIALAFVLEHPAVTAAIIGPRTMEQLESQFGAADASLGQDALDRIDAIVAPGANLNPVDAGYTPPSLAGAAQRRRTERA
jgi:aryl-alcohol dehydrogenase-like predicted oxidoreductase